MNFFCNLAVFSYLLLCSCTINTNNSSIVNSKTLSSTKKYPKLEFINEVYNLGQVIEGEIIETVFYYKNIGDKDLLLNKVEASFGCTNVKWDKKPLRPGEESKIIVSFNSHGRKGKQYKTISVFSNCLTNVNTLVLTAQVE